MTTPPPSPGANACTICGVADIHTQQTAFTPPAYAHPTVRMCIDALKARCTTLESQAAAYAGAPVEALIFKQHGYKRVRSVDDDNAEFFKVAKGYSDMVIELIARPNVVATPPRASCVWTREDLPSNHGHRTACGSWYSISATFCLGNPDSDVPLYCPDCGHHVEVANAPVTVSTLASKEGV